jgi:hypothetical protein
MIQTAIRMKTRILPGKRIEFTSPELPDDGDVELVIYLPESPAPDAPRKFKDVIEFIDSLPGRNRTPEEWAALERGLQEEKEAWER